MAMLVRRVSRQVWLLHCMLLATLLVACSTVGHHFRSDRASLEQLTVGQTTPEDAIRVLGGKPYIRQNLPDGTMAWHWQSVTAAAYVGVTDNRLLVLKFAKDVEGTWRLSKVLHAQNIDIPEKLPVDTVVK